MSSHFGAQMLILMNTLACIKGNTRAPGLFVHPKHDEFMVSFSVDCAQDDAEAAQCGTF